MELINYKNTLAAETKQFEALLSIVKERREEGYILSADNADCVLETLIDRIIKKSNTGMFLGDIYEMIGNALLWKHIKIKGEYNDLESFHENARLIHKDFTK